MTVGYGDITPSNKYHFKYLYFIYFSIIKYIINYIIIKIYLSLQ